MIRIANAQLWVHDQSEALEFYTSVLGFEVREDFTVAEMGNFRWLTVSPPGQEDITICLMAIPGEPIMDDATREQVQSVLAKGFAGTVFLTTDDVHARYEELTARGLEFAGPPTEQLYGIDASFRDPSGNHFRLTQLKQMPAEYQTAALAGDASAS
ncbi:MAG: glyoxalase [Thermoleophilia bacterium]|nr:glyoxalase [Thermoleophilia bacterium]